MTEEHEVTRGEIRLEILSDARLLESVRGLVRGYTRSLGFREAEVEQVVLAIDEACGNSIRHAYGGRPDRPIELAIASTRTHVEFVLRDGGKPAPADRVARRRLTKPDPRDMEPGGLGVQFIYKTFDEVEFSRGTTRGNRVRMRLRIPSAKRSGRS